MIGKAGFKIINGKWIAIDRAMRNEIAWCYLCAAAKVGITCIGGIVGRNSINRRSLAHDDHSHGAIAMREPDGCTAACDLC